jgi:phosphoglycerate dehydrogenase-like enzyme
VHSLTTGLDWMDKSLAGLFEKHNVPLSNARGCYSVPLAEHVIMSVLYFNRSVARLHSLRRAREWNRFPSPSTTNQRMVIVGYGDIAREVARVATQGMRMSIVGVRASATEESVDDLGTRVVPSSAMQKELAEADFVCLVLPKTPATHHLFNAEMIALLKPSCVVINIGRGSTVDEAALSEALHAGRIKGAALDVFDVEPLPASSPLWDLSDDRVLITSHNADITPDLWELASAQFMRFADKFVSENELPQYTTSLTRGY